MDYSPSGRNEPDMTERLHFHFPCPCWLLHSMEQNSVCPTTGTCWFSTLHIAANLWCWRRLLRVPWTARISNCSILKEINPEYSSEGLMLKLQYFGQLM